MATASSFAAVLRRSKFASFDPQISQVFTAHGGYAHRGDFGLKRPLPVRRRGAAVTVTAMDSRIQQTEWQGASVPANFIAQWDEGTRVIELDESHPRDNYRTLEQAFDSDYAPKPSPVKPRSEDLSEDLEASPEEPEEPDEPDEPEEVRIPEIQNVTRAIPNVAAMSPRNFDRYLERVRGLRPDFREWLRIQRSKDKKGQSIAHDQDINLYAHSQQTTKHDSQFLSDVWGKHYDDETSYAIEPHPHKVAALSYSHGSKLQTRLLERPLPGHNLQGYASQGRGKSLDDRTEFFVGVAGITAKMTRKGAAGLTPAIRRDNGEFFLDEGRGRGMFQINKAILRADPAVVTDHLISTRHDYGLRKDRLLNARLDAQVYNVSRADPSTWNPHAPGTRDYIAHSAGLSPNSQQYRMPASLIPPPNSYYAKRADASSTSTSELMSNLQGLLRQRGDNAPAGQSYYTT